MEFKFVTQQSAINGVNEKKITKENLFLQTGT